MKSMYKEVEKVENNISEAKSGISVTNDLILQAQGYLEKAQETKGEVVQKQLIETATAKFKVGNERKRKFEEDLCKLELEKKKRKERQISVIKMKVKFIRLHTCYVELS